MATRSLFSIVFIPLFFSFQADSFQCDKGDQQTLLKIKAELGHPLKLASWNPAATDCCSWNGVICDVTTGHVTALNINSAKLSASIPPSLAYLPWLGDLTLDNIPGLTGPIPSSFANITVSSLSITRTALSGPIPAFLGRNAALRSIDLSSNHLSGPIPATLTGTLISSINLSRNRLTGSIPASLFLHAGPDTVPFLYLSRNKLSGAIPKSFAKLDFDTIDLSRNMLTGDASLIFGAKKRATHIDLSMNRMEFDMANLAFPRLLEALDLSGNKISGSIPCSIVRLKSLGSFNVSGNRLCDRIPQGGQMWRFAADCFAGNDCLCGKPLSPCSWKVTC